MKSTVFRILSMGVLAFCVLLSAPLESTATPQRCGLTIIEPDGKPGSSCPLEHTSVKADVSGFIALVKVKQVFRNPMKEKIEAVYTFPLSATGAVTEMVMKVGKRVVKGVIKRKEEARRIYEAARDRGKVASLLDQERPNIFTQSVANIMPGEKVEISITYVDILPYDDGAFRFVFPMVVAPRFIPGRPDGKQGTGWAKDTTSVPDASRITPPVAEEGKRAGHDIDITVSIDAGVPIERIASKLHDVDVKRNGKTKAVVSLKNKKEIPNKDFVLEYQVAADRIRSGVLAHKDGKDGYVTVIMIPPKRVEPSQVAPRELIFIVDRSGSQSGRPLAVCKKTMKYVIERMNPKDTFNFVDFANDARMLFSYPKKATPENREKALRYISSLRGGGGTQMAGAIWEALKSDPAENRLRIVTFMTDGLVGNDFEIIDMVRKLRGKSRWFTFGTGNSVNRYLIDNVARTGGGEAEYVLLNTKPETVAKRFYKRIASPVLTDIEISWDGVELKDVYPSALSDLWSQKPLIFKARYSEAGKGIITISGFKAGKPYKQAIKVDLPEREKGNEALPFLWARAKVKDLMDKDLMGIQQGKPRKEIKEAIIQVALRHRLVTQFTSFVAVEETTITTGGKPVKVTVPVEMADGVSREGVFGRKTGRIRHKATGGYVAAKARSTQVLSFPPVPPGMVAREAPKEEAFMAPSAPGKAWTGRPQADVAVASGLERKLKGKADKKESPSCSKLHAGLVELVRMKKKPSEWSKGKVRVSNGKVTVKVWLNKCDDAVLKLLEQKGLKIVFKAATGKVVIGTIPVDKLKALCGMEQIVLVEPFAVVAQG